MITWKKEAHHVDEVRVGPFTAFGHPQNIGEKLALREQVLDQLHHALENDPYPDEPVTVTALTPTGKRLGLYLPSLRERKHKYPSAEARRKLLGFQVADYLTALGV